MPTLLTVVKKTLKNQFFIKKLSFLCFSSLLKAIVSLKDCKKVNTSKVELMKKTYFITLLIMTHVLFVALQINKESQFVKLSYEQQRYEQECKKLLTQKQTLQNRIYALQEQGAIKKYASEKLAMQPLSLKQVKRIQAS